MQGGGVQVPIQAAEKLARHLRENPSDASRDTSELAEEFELPHHFVSSFVGHLRQDISEAPVRERRKDGKSAVGGAIGFLRQLFRRATQAPVLFVFITTAIALLIGIVFSHIDLIKTMPRGVGFQIDSLWTLLLILGVLVLHFACYFRTGMARVVFHGTVWVWLLTTSVLLVTVWLRATSSTQADAIQILLSLLVMELFSIFAAAIYACAALCFSTFGAYVRVRSGDRAEQKMGRQEQLARLFELQERLKIVQSGGGRAGLFEHPIAKWITARLVLVIAGSGFLGTLLSIVGRSLTYSGAERADQTGLIIFALFGLVGMGAMFIGLIAVGFFAKNLKELLVNFVIFTVASFLPVFIPLPGYGIENAANSFQPTQTSISILFTFAITLVAQLGRIIEQRAERERLLQENDPATLYGEIVKIQWRLSPSTKSVCVMVVDAAKSSAMKVGANPLEVEYTFREYQKFIAEHSTVFSGRIHSTAGDGAVVAFPSCIEAFQAARQIQTHIEQFNRGVNRLANPFRLRIGLHAGEVVAELDEVQFTAVIDVAAHIEAAAPIEGIAVSNVVAAELEDERFAALETPIDGYKVHIALVPKL